MRDWYAIFLAELISNKPKFKKDEFKNLKKMYPDFISTTVRLLKNENVINSSRRAFFQWAGKHTEQEKGENAIWFILISIPICYRKEISKKTILDFFDCKKSKNDFVSEERSHDSHIVFQYCKNYGKF